MKPRPAPRKRPGPACGERNGNAVLCNFRINSARKWRDRGNTWVDIAEWLNCNEATVRRAVKGQTWRDAR